MIFIVSDLHLGKRPETDAGSLQELGACINASKATTVVFLGDVFDAFVESSHRPPDPFHAWSALARQLKKSGLDLLYVMGNHDRWHRRLVADTVGSAPIRHSTTLHWNDQSVLLEHGDRGQSHGLITRFARWLSDQPWMHDCYTLFLPFGGAQSLAAAVSRRFASFDPNPETVGELKNYALTCLKERDTGGMVMGHCHQSDLVDFSEELDRRAWYANSGDWYESRSFVLLDDAPAGVQPASIRLCTWQDGEILEQSSLIAH